MPIVATCACGKQLRAADEHAGRQAKCPACGRAVQIPVGIAPPPPPVSAPGTPDWPDLAAQGPTMAERRAKVRRLRDAVGCAVVLAVAAALVWGSVAPRVREYRRRKEGLLAFTSHIRQYLKPFRSGASYPLVSGGKVVLIDKSQRKVDPLQLDLSRELRATSPKDVGMIVWLEWGRKTLHRYENDTAGTQPYCYVTIIDSPNPVGVERVLVEGELPPPVWHRSGGYHPDRPAKKVLDLVAKAAAK